ncbi:hypothetical protein GCM10009777_37060 [Microbacterium pumilum]|uniref:Uncharacterized protein n=1 Tax=Microbacterium pumilum TaxID=344165 RepID=A0ABP5EFA3_9MICO
MEDAHRRGAGLSLGARSRRKGDQFKQFTEGRALCRGNVGMQFAFGRASVPLSRAEQLSAFGRGDHDVGPTIRGVCLTTNEASLLEIVDEGNNLTGIQAEECGKIPLRWANLVDYERKDGVRPHPQAVPGEGEIASGKRERVGPGEKKAQVFRQGGVAHAFVGRERCVIHGFHPACHTP